MKTEKKIQKLLLIKKKKNETVQVRNLQKQMNQK